MSHDVQDSRAFEQDVRDFLERHVSERIGEIEFGGLLLELSDIQRRHGVITHRSWTSLCLSLVAAEGLARHLDPDLDVAQTLSPKLKRYLRKLYLMAPQRRAA